MAKAGIPIPSDTEETAKPKSKKLLIIIIAVLVLGGAGGAGWFFTRGGDHHAEEVKVEPLPEPKFVALEPFTVNLQQEGGEKFLQIGITLKFTELELEEKIKLRMPELRSRIVLLLSSKHATELIPAEGKKMLAHEIAVEASAALGLPAPPPFMPAATEAGESAVVAETAATSASAVAQVPSAASAPQATHTAAAAHTAEPSQIDVLFTSFIIQ